MAELAKNESVHVRFIEMMPIGIGREYRGKTEDELLAELREAFGDYEISEDMLGNGPAHYYTFPGFKGKIGFISAVSHKFCHKCNRVRLTSQGYLKTCLQYDTGADLKQLLRGGATDEELSRAIKQAVLQKPAGHHFGEAQDSYGKAKHFGEEQDQHDETNMMAQIGG